MKAQVSGAWRAITSGQVCVGGVWKRITRATVYHGGAWKSADTFAPPMTVSTSTPEAAGFGSGYIVSQSVTATPNGGLAPYTYAWTRISGSTATATAPAAATTAFSGYPGFNSNSTDTFTCTVTDALGQTASANVDVFLDDFGGSFF